MADQTGVGTARHAAGVTALPAERMVRKRPNEVRGFVDQNSASWNQVFSWLHKIDRLREAA